MSRDTKRKLMALVNEYVRCSVADSWKGVQRPEDVPIIEAELVLAEAKLKHFVEKML